MKLTSILRYILGVAVLGSLYPAEAYSGDICRSVSRSSHYGGVATHYRAASHSYKLNHGYATFVAVEPYYSVDVVGAEERQLRAKAERIDLKEKLDRQAIEMEVLKDLLSRQLSPQGGPVSFSQGGASGNDPAVAQILKTHCAKCHTGDTAEKGFRLYQEGGSPLSWGADIKYLVESVTNDRSMPPNSPISDEDYQKIRAWYEADRRAVRDLILNSQKEE